MSYLTPFRALFDGLTHLIYPNLCVACGKDVPPNSICFCMPCRHRLAETTMHRNGSDNEFTQRLWGRLPLSAATSMYYFYKKNPIQRALHQLKYKNRPDVGLKIGREMGRLMLESVDFQSIDAIVPVPLHPAKERLRGYNQSLLFAEGIGISLGIPVRADLLVRKTFTASQTRKKRLERHKNVNDMFVVEDKSQLYGKHFLLVDDVLTTGATLEICGRALLQAPQTRISAATIAIAMKR
jgi:ComF family protein